MNTSFFNSIEMLSKPYIENIKPSPQQAFLSTLSYNLNQEQLTAIALRLAPLFPWQNFSQFTPTPFPGFNNLLLWPDIQKTTEKYIIPDITRNKDMGTYFKDHPVVVNEEIEQLSEAINLKKLSPKSLDPIRSYNSSISSDHEEKLSVLSTVNNKQDRLSQSGRKRRKSGFQSGVTVGYTYEAFFISDGRSKKRKSMNNSGRAEKGNSKKIKKDVETTQGITIIEEVAETSTKPLRFICSECGKNYATSSNLSRHKQTHRTLDSQQARKCPHCEKIYVSMPALSMHILTHDLRHQCDICGKAFSRPWLLQGHRRAHTGEKPYGCAHCGRAFADRSNLRAHMQTHSALKTYECEACKKNFALKSYLNKHLESSCCTNC